MQITRPSHPGEKCQVTKLWMHAQRLMFRRREQQHYARNAFHSPVDKDSSMKRLLKWSINSSAKVRGEGNEPLCFGSSGGTAHWNCPNDENGECPFPLLPQRFC